MSNIIKKLDKFRSSTPFFFFGILNSLLLFFLSFRLLFFVEVFSFEFYIRVFSVIFGGLATWGFSEFLSRRTDKNSPLLFPSTNLLKLSGFFFSAKTHNEVFKSIYADWQEEYFEALFRKEIWKARWINVRYTYAFLAAMWQKSPIGDLIEFINKIAK